MYYQNERKALRQAQGKPQLRVKPTCLMRIRGEGPLDFGAIGLDSFHARTCPKANEVSRRIYGNPQVMTVDFKTLFKTPK